MQFGSTETTKFELVKVESSRQIILSTDEKLKPLEINQLLS
jgi:hypothetical protein